MCVTIRAVARTLIAWGVYIHVSMFCPTNFPFKLNSNRTIRKEICRAEHEYMNILPPARCEVFLRSISMFKYLLNFVSACQAITSTAASQAPTVCLTSLHPRQGSSNLGAPPVPRYWNAVRTSAGQQRVPPVFASQGTRERLFCCAKVRWRKQRSRRTRKARSWEEVSRLQAG